MTRDPQRIYEPYPYDYILLFADKKDISQELLNIETDQMRANHSKYLKIHEGVFKRTNINNKIINNLLYIKYNVDIVSQKLDIYSLGFILFPLYNQIAAQYEIPDSLFLQCFTYPEIQGHLNLLRDMTEYYAIDRISPEEAYKRYKKLI